jgi:hypothetical protein
MRPGGHLVQTAHGGVFILPPDNACVLIRGMTELDRRCYLPVYASQGFSLLKVSLLAGMDGLNRPPPQALRILVNSNPA